MAKPETKTAEAKEAKVPAKRGIQIKDPKSGKMVARQEWIRQVYSEVGGEYYGQRAKIAAKLSEIQGKHVPFQIVFAATKGDKAPAEAFRKSKEAAKAASEAKAAQ